MATKIAHIASVGAYLPERVLTNADLEEMVNTSDEWIRTRTGIVERRIAAADEYTSCMGIRAAQRALEEAQLAPTDIDAIIVATMTPDYISPSTAALIQHGLGATKAIALDIQAACTGFLYGLSMAKAWVESGTFRRVLLIATEKNSAFIDYKDRNTCVLFGDGAGACVVQTEGKYAIGRIVLGADGEQSGLIAIPGSGCRAPTPERYLAMQGREVFKHAVRRMEQAIGECLQEDRTIDWLVPHQANIRIIEAIAERLEMPLERVVRTVHKYGNTSSSSIPIALAECPSKPGDKVLLVGFGGGLTWGAAMLQQVQ